MDCSPPGSSVHRISQARTLEWVAISFFRKSSQPRIKPASPALQADSLPLSHGGKPGFSIGKESACGAGDLGSSPWSGRSPEEGNGNPLQYSCLGNPMDREAWRVTIHGCHKESDTTERLTQATKPLPCSTESPEVFWWSPPLLLSKDRKVS